MRWKTLEDRWLAPPPTCLLASFPVVFVDPSHEQRERERERAVLQLGGTQLIAEYNPMHAGVVEASQNLFSLDPC